MGFSKLNYYVLLLLRLHGEAQAFVGGEKVMEKFQLEYNSYKVAVFAGFIEIELRLFATQEKKSNLSKLNCCGLRKKHALNIGSSTHPSDTNTCREPQYYRQELPDETDVERSKD